MSDQVGSESDPHHPDPPTTSAAPATADDASSSDDGASPEQVREQTLQAGADVAAKPENRRPEDDDQDGRPDGPAVS